LAKKARRRHYFPETPTTVPGASSRLLHTSRIGNSAWSVEHLTCSNFVT
jgi:hypothetical protein